MKGDKKIIDILNELLVGELTAVDQYLIHGEFTVMPLPSSHTVLLL